MTLKLKNNFKKWLIVTINGFKDIINIYIYVCVCVYILVKVIFEIKKMFIYRLSLISYNFIAIHTGNV